MAQSIKNHAFIPLGAWLCGLALAASSPAQSIVETRAFGAVGDGASPEAVGDVDADGILDYVVRLPADDASGAQAGRIRVHSGADGSVLLDLQGDGPGALFGFAVTALGDVDDDGHDDFAVGAPGATGSGRPGSVFVHSGADGSVLRRHDGAVPGDAFGHALGVTRDRDGDGVLDLLVGAPGHDAAGSDAGRVTLHSTSTGNLLGTYDGHAAGNRFGAMIGSIVVGPWGMDVGTTGGLDATYGGDAPGGGHIDGLDATTGASVCLADEPALVHLALADDVDGDGTNDVLATSFDPAAQTSTARIRSGADGDLLATFVSEEAATGFGRAFTVIPDMDGDALRDLAFGEPDAGTGQGRIVLVSSAGGDVLHRICGPVDGLGFGASLALVPDRSADGHPDLAIGALADPDGRARVTILSLRSAANMALSGDATLAASVDGDDVQVILREAPADSPVLLAMGTALRVDASLTALHTVTDVTVGNLVTDDSGALDYSTPLPNGLVGQPLYFEAVIAESAGTVDVTDPVTVESAAE